PAARFPSFLFLVFSLVPPSLCVVPRPPFRPLGRKLRLVLGPAASLWMALSAAPAVPSPPLPPPASSTSGPCPKTLRSLPSLKAPALLHCELPSQVLRLNTFGTTRLLVRSRAQGRTSLQNRNSRSFRPTEPGDPRDSVDSAALDFAGPNSAWPSRTLRPSRFSSPGLDTPLPKRLLRSHLSPGRSVLHLAHSRAVPCGDF
ncbi:unnamed protein product, partial [Mycena citricolor]